MRPRTIDHVAFWVARRDEAAARILETTGMHEIERTESFTLLGADARRFKLTLFDAEGPREPGAFAHVALRVNRLAAGAARILDAGEGLRLVLVEGPAEVEWDLDHVALRAADPAAAAEAYARYGFAPAGEGRVEAGGAFVVLEAGAAGKPPERPLLNHLAVLVDSADEAVAEAHELGIEVESVVDAANTYAAFLKGPEGVRIEYVEHKPTFALE